MAVIACEGGRFPAEGSGRLLPGFGEGGGALASKFLAVRGGCEQNGFPGGFRARLFSFPSFPSCLC